MQPVQFDILILFWRGAALINVHVLKLFYIEYTTAETLSYSLTDSDCVLLQVPHFLGSCS
jgi:hypothetical protein